MLELAFAFFDLITAQVLLGFRVCLVLASDWVVFLEADFFSGVLDRVVRTVARSLRNETNEFAL